MFDNVDNSPVMPDRSESREEAILRARLREQRLSIGLTQTDVAHRLGKPQSYVSKYESGERTLSLLEVRAVCLAIGITLEALVGELETRFAVQ